MTSASEEMLHAAKRARELLDPVVAEALAKLLEEIANEAGDGRGVELERGHISGDDVIQVKRMVSTVTSQICWRWCWALDLARAINSKTGGGSTDA